MTINKDVSTQIRLKQLSAEIKACKVIHPRVERGLELMAEGVESASNGGTRSGVMVTGESRSGKTKLLRIFQERAAEHGCDPTKILYVSLSGPTTVNGLVTSLLEALGDPMPETGDFSQRKRRLEKGLLHSGYTMVQIDEAQQTIDHRSDEVVHDIADYFKGLMNPKNSSQPQLPICFVLSGTPSLQRLLQFNSQLNNRFFAPLDLQLFSTASELDLKDLRMLLIKLEQQIDVAKSSRLGTSEMAVRFRAASGGCIGIIVDIFEHAGKNAIRESRESITISDLAEAYDLLMPAGKLSLGNPFRAALTAVTQAALVAPTLRAGRRAVGRRSRAKRKEVTLGHVLNIGATG